MKTLKISFLFLISLIFVLVSCKSADDDYALPQESKALSPNPELATQLLATQSIWQSLTQADRNSRIVTQARHDLGLTGGACKVWANDAVRAASNVANGNTTQTRTLPLTSSWQGVSESGYTWISSSFVTAITGTGSNLNQAVAGSIIQMRTHLSAGGYTPHTAIVESNNGSSLTFIESNYATPYVVTRRGPISYTTFKNGLEMPTYYTIYLIQ